MCFRYYWPFSFNVVYYRDHSVNGTLKWLPLQYIYKEVLIFIKARLLCCLFENYPSPLPICCTSFLETLRIYELYVDSSGNFFGGKRGGGGDGKVHVYLRHPNKHITHVLAHTVVTCVHTRDLGSLADSRLVRDARVKFGKEWMTTATGEEYQEVNSFCKARQPRLVGKLESQGVR